jgi:hypothetical protein
LAVLDSGVAICVVDFAEVLGAEERNGIPVDEAQVSIAGLRLEYVNVDYGIAVDGAS